VETLVRERHEHNAVSAAARSRLDDVPRLLHLHDEISDAAAGAGYLAALAPQLEPGDLDEALQRLNRHALPCWAAFRRIGASQCWPGDVPNSVSSARLWTRSGNGQTNGTGPRRCAR
jgi:hypothetical protein